MFFCGAIPHFNIQELNFSPGDQFGTVLFVADLEYFFLMRDSCGFFGRFVSPDQSLEAGQQAALFGLLSSLGVERRNVFRSISRFTHDRILGVSAVGGKAER